MTEKQTYGFWVSVPEGNGYTRESFRDIVAPHLDRLVGSTFVPALGQRRDVVGEDSVQIVKSTDRDFGVSVEISAPWWNEIYIKAGLTTEILKSHYGLEVKPASVSFERDFKVTFTVDQRSGEDK